MFVFRLSLLTHHLFYKNLDKLELEHISIFGQVTTIGNIRSVIFKLVQIEVYYKDKDITFLKLENPLYISFSVVIVSPSNIDNWPILP